MNIRTEPATATPYGDVAVLSADAPTAVAREIARGARSNALFAERVQTDSRLFAHTRWDAIPVAAGILHCAYFFGMFFLFPRTPLWVMMLFGFIYSISISWNINGISHNYIHNPYFRLSLLNRL